MKALDLGGRGDRATAIVFLSALCRYNVHGLNGEHLDRSARLSFVVGFICLSPSGRSLGVNGVRR